MELKIGYTAIANVARAAESAAVGLVLESPNFRALCPSPPMGPEIGDPTAAKSSATMGVRWPTR